MSDKPLESLRFLAELRILETTGEHNDVLVNALLPLLKDAYDLGYGHGFIHASSGATDGR